MEKPKVYRMEDWDTSYDDVIPGSYITSMKKMPGLGDVGLYFMPPGTQTTPESTVVFSLE